MTDETDRLDRGVMSVLERRHQTAGDPLPWEQVADRAPASDPGPPVKTRWLAAAASLLLVVGAVAVLSTVVGNDDPAVTELPPPTLEAIDIAGVGPTRPLSSIARRDAVVPTRLFRGLVLEPVIVYDTWTSHWSAHAGVRDESDVVIDIDTGMDGEQFGSPDAVISAAGTDWTVRTFGAGQHHAFARFDQFAVFVSVEGMGLGDLAVLLDGLRAGDPQAHPASTYDADEGGVEVARSATGSHELLAASVGEWFCTSIRSIGHSAAIASCVLPAAQDDGSMLLTSSVTGTPVDENSTDPDDAMRTSVFSVGFVPSDAIGADISHVDGSTEFARAEDRSGEFDVRWFLGVKTLDDPAGLEPEEGFEQLAVTVAAVYDD